MDIVSPLKTARLKKGITQTQLSERVGVTKSAVAAWESGDANPAADKLAALSRALRPHLNLGDYLKHVETTSERVA